MASGGCSHVCDNERQLTLFHISEDDHDTVPTGGEWDVPW